MRLISVFANSVSSLTSNFSNISVMSLVISLCVGSIGVGFTQELTVQNPSFEDNLPPLRLCVDKNDNKVPGSTEWNCPWTRDNSNQYKNFPRKPGDPGIFGMTTIAPWTQCSGTVDLLPNAPGLSVNKAPAHGDWYFGMVCDNRNAPASEAFAQQLSAPFTAGLTYTFDISLATNGSPYWSGQLAEPGRLYIIGRMGAGVCGAPQGVADQQILWDSGPVKNSDWQSYDITFVPTKAWTHIYLTMSDQNTCKQNGSNILIDKIGSFFPGGLKITSPSASANMPCSQKITGRADENIDVLTVAGTFDGGIANASVLPSGTDWELDVTYSNQTARVEILKVVAQYVDPTIIPDTIEVPVNIAGPLNDFGASVVDVNNPVGFSDLSAEYDAGNTVAYLWDFGDGNTSTETNPSHTYATEGAYDVTQTITYNGKCVETVSKQIVIPNEPGVVNITTPKGGATINDCSVLVEGTTNYRPDQIVVNGSPAGAVFATMTSETTWEAEIYYSGNSSGDQALTVEATFPANTATDSRSFTLAVTGSISAGFTSALSDATNPYAGYQFTNTSDPIAQIGGYEWQFNTEGTLEQRDASWTFANFGPQRVRMIATPTNPLACGDIALDTFSIATPVLAEEGQLFNDANEDGQLDQVTLQFVNPISEEMLDAIEFQFKWFNNKDSLLTLRSDSTSFEIDPNNPNRIIWNLPDSLGVKKFSTDVKLDYGTPIVLFNLNDSLGNTVLDTVSVELEDGMKPLVVNAQITQSSRRSSPDRVTIVFSEVLDYKEIDTEGLFTFKIAKNGFSQDTSVSHDPILESNWVSNGKVLVLNFSFPHKILYPGDSLKAIAAVGKIVDLEGNTALENAPYVEIGGESIQKVEYVEFVDIDPSTEPDSAFNDPVFFENGVDIEQATGGQLGVYFTLPRPNLESGNLGTGRTGQNLNAEDISWEWQLIYYDNLGTFVVDQRGVINCTDEVFKVNGAIDCTDSSIGGAFIKWNYKDQYGRKVGSGAYIQQFIINEEASEPALVGLTRRK